MQKWRDLLLVNLVLFNSVFLGKDLFYNLETNPTITTVLVWATINLTFASFFILHALIKYKILMTIDDFKNDSPFKRVCEWTELTKQLLLRLTTLQKAKKELSHT